MHAQLIPLPVKPVTLRRFIFISSLVVSFTSFTLVLGITILVSLKTVEHNALRVAAEMSGQISHAIPVLMAKGWGRKELLSLYDVPASTGSTPTHSIQIYRSGIIAKQYGRSDLPANQDVEKAFHTGLMVKRRINMAIDTIYPLFAGEDCLPCHAGAWKGEVLGALMIRQNIEPMIREARTKIFILFLALSPIPFLMAFLIARVVNRRVAGAVTHLQHKVTDVNNIRDLTKLEFADIQPGFSEFERIFAEIGTLVTKMREVSVDRGILEFEIRILEKFIITSDVIRDWKEHVSLLLLEIN